MPAKRKRTDPLYLAGKLEEPFEKFVLRVMKGERERCAAVCDEISKNFFDASKTRAVVNTHDKDRAYGAMCAALAIRKLK